MTLLRGLADDLRLDVWLLGYMMPVERAFVRPDFVALGHHARLRRDDPVGHDLLRRHVLLRGGRGRRDGEGGHARTLRPDGPEIPGARRGELRRLAEPRPRVHHRVERPPLDHAGGRTACPLHLHRRNSSRVRRAGARARRPASYASRGDVRSKSSNRARNTGCR